MGESERREGRDRAVEGSALPEGAAVDESAADFARREDLPPLHSKFESADSLDLLAALDEPELLVRALKKLADERRGKGWAVVKTWAGYTEEALRIANEPGPNRPA
jgi:hypothetical protein